MKSPCRNCPFRTDRVFPLEKGRRTEIADSLFKDSDFPCHKTFTNVDDYRAAPHKSKRCAGAAIFLENARPGGLKSNLAFRLALMSGEIEIQKLDLAASVAKTYQEFINQYLDS